MSGYQRAEVYQTKEGKSVLGPDWSTVCGVNVILSTTSRQFGICYPSLTAFWKTLTLYKRNSEHTTPLST